MNSILKIIAGILIVALGAGVVIYLDSKSDFKGKSEQGFDLCEHKIDRNKCFVCLPEIIEKSNKCDIHNRSLALCVICDPLLIKVFKSQNDWCVGHDRPESQCEKCNPELVIKPKETNKVVLANAKEAFKIIPKDKWLRDTVKDSFNCDVERSTIQFTSPLTAQNAGLEYQSVLEKPFSKSISCPISIQYNGNQFVQITARTTGFMVEVKKEIGETVKAGEVLAYIKSNELIIAKAEFLQAYGLVKLNQNNYDREKKLVENMASTEFNLSNAKSKLIESEITYGLSEQKLVNFELNKEQIQKLKDGGNTLDLFPIITPIAGTILERQKNNGESLDLGIKLFSVSDISNMWAILDIYDRNAFEVKIGQKVIITIDGLQGDHWDGVIAWISTQIDPTLRTLKARVEISNKSSILKAGMLGNAKIKIADEMLGLIVPKVSVQWDGCCYVVFVKVNDYVLEPRKVKIINEAQESYIVTGNLKVGEQLVTTGSFLMKTEIAKGSIGAGCCPE
jgi:cobalt-zinc-cadmium efflux system membrane fusion protein